MDTVRQLLPVANRAHRHSMAAFGTRLCKGDMATTAKRVASQTGPANNVTVTYYVGGQGDCGGERHLFFGFGAVSTAAFLELPLHRDWRVDSAWLRRGPTLRGPLSNLPV
jgi:hypothetical protein